MNVSRALPRRNPMILTAYAIAIIGMLGFMVWLIWPYQVAETRPDIHSSTSTSTSTPVRVTTGSGPESPVYRESLKIVGSSQWIELNCDSHPQIEGLWRRFAERDLAAELFVKEALSVYAVYHRYDASRNRVLLTLGYPVATNRVLPRQTEAILIAAGDYLRLPGGEVLQAWDDADLVDQLKYAADFEEYQLDRSYNVLSQTAFVALR